MSSEARARDERLGVLFSQAFSAEHPAMLDYVSLRFELQTLRAMFGAMSATQATVETLRSECAALRDEDARKAALIAELSAQWDLLHENFARAAFPLSADGMFVFIDGAGDVPVADFFRAKPAQELTT